MPRRCATGSTGTPAVSSSPPRTRRPCGSSTRRSGPTSWKSPTSASPWDGPSQPEGKIEGFLLKDEVKKEVRFFHKPVPGGKTAVTLYRTLESRGGLSLVECRLLTGRTHQIRVSMAEIGCPLLGDGKYGKGDVNRRYHETRQALYSYKLRFDFPTDAGLLNYLKGQEFTVENVPFREKYFPEIPS